MTSIIRQRQHIVGERNSAIAFLAIGLVSIGFALTSSIFTDTFSAAGAAGVGLGLAAIGAFRLHSTRRKLAAFEAEHGVGAGKQPSIR